jgi:hypothetical protein
LKVEMMDISCKDRDRIFEDGTPAEWAALERHAAGCTVCAEEVGPWKALSVAASELRSYEESPALWTRIESALREEAGRQAERRARRWWLPSWTNVAVGWQAALAGALVLVLALAGWIYIVETPGLKTGDASLLRSKALKQVESTESAYVQAIDKLAAEAKPQLESPATPLQANYREKLLVLDSAIADLREQAGLNPSNAQLRYQLLAMYQEKQKTLEEVLEAKQR